VIWFIILQRNFIFSNFYMNHLINQSQFFHDLLYDRLKCPYEFSIAGYPGFITICLEDDNQRIFWRPRQLFLVLLILSTKY